MRIRALDCVAALRSLSALFFLNVVVSDIQSPRKIKSRVGSSRFLASWRGAQWRSRREISLSLFHSAVVSLHRF